MTLTKNEYIWAVSTVSKDDGNTYYWSYWTDYEKANKEAIKSGGHVVQTTLWSDETGSYYECNPREILVDPPNKSEVLNKLTKKERQVLGLS